MTHMWSGVAAGIEWAAATDTGRWRSENQDAWLVEATPAGLLLAVADGMGGHANGAWASQFAVAALSRAVRAAEPARLDLAALVTGINAELVREAALLGTPDAGTTLVAALVRNGRIRWVSIGDSRIYRREGSELIQVSRDHNLAAEPDGHPGLANVLTRCLGGSNGHAEADSGEAEVAAGLLLATDGLYHQVESETLAEALSAPHLAHAAARLVDLANDAGGPDNITVVLARPSATG